MSEHDDKQQSKRTGTKTKGGLGLSDSHDKFLFYYARVYHLKSKKANS